MEISYNWLQSYFKDKLPPPEKLAEVLTMYSLEVETVGQKGGDYIFGIAILPNRIFDYVKHLGVIRDISAVLRLNANTPPFSGEYRSVYLNFGDIEKILGASVSEERVIDILTRLGMQVVKEGEKMTVEVPTFRPDVETKEDMIEEVARIYGYEKIEAKAPGGLLLSPERNDNFFYASMVRRVLTGFGFDEVYNYSFSNKGEFELENQAMEGRKFLRVNLIDSLNENIKSNERYFKNVKVFEIGKTFPRGGEVISLAGATSQQDFYEIKGITGAILKSLNISDFYYKESAEKVAEIRVGNSSLGVLDHGCFELNFEEFVKLANENVEYRPVSKYPAIMRDLAIFVPLRARVGEVTDIIENAAGELLVDSDLFDIYEKGSRKSLAFHLAFQSQEKTLTDEEINDVVKKVFEALESNPDWEVRK